MIGSSAKIEMFLSTIKNAKTQRTQTESNKKGQY
jgi:hypothetical protein